MLLPGDLALKSMNPYGGYSYSNHHTTPSPNTYTKQMTQEAERGQGVKNNVPRLLVWYSVRHLQAALTFLTFLFD